MKNTFNYTLIYAMFCLFGSEHLSAQHLKITGGNLLVNNYCIVLKDMNLVNNGTFTSDKGNVYFTGENNATIDGENTPNFDTLTIVKTSGAIQLNRDIAINQQLRLDGGKVKLQSSNIEMGSTADISGADNDKYVQTDGTGQLFQYVSNANNAKTFPVGNSTYNPVILNLGFGTSDTCGVRVKDEVLENGNSGDAITEYVINRTWEITENTAGGSDDLTATFHWESDQELGISGSGLGIAQYNGGWNNLAGTEGNNLGLNSINGTIDGVGNFAIFEDRSPKVDGYFCDNEWDVFIDDPIAYLQNRRALNDLFSDQKINASGNVLFTAGNSINLHAGFEVQAGAAFHAYIATCEFLGELVEVESRTTAKTVIPKSTLQLAVYPNPFNRQTNIQFFLPEATTAQLIICDMQGRIIKQQTYYETISDWQQTTFEAGNLPAGMYILTLFAGKEKAQKQLILIE